MTPDRLIEVATGQARSAADAAGILVRRLEGAAEAGQAADLFADVWAVGPAAAPISGDLVRALVYTGNYGAGAWAGSHLVGASVGFLALERGTLSLHSHITGVAAAARGTNVGFALKQHQRAWALGFGIHEVTWTFDPLIRTNAWFNLIKLGAVAVSYHPNFYAEMRDGVNAGDRSDRCQVSWVLDSSKAMAASAAAGARDHDPGEAANPAPGGTTLLTVDPGGEPAVAADVRGVGDLRSSLRPDGRGPLLCQVPVDIVAMRSVDPGRARAWRDALHDTMGAAMAAGFVASSITRDGWYVLTPSENEEWLDENRGG